MNDAEIIAKMRERLEESLRLAHELDDLKAAKCQDVDDAVRVELLEQ